MENQSDAAPVEGAAQEVSSTTPAVEPTKRSLRVQTWKKIQDNRCGIGFNAIFNRIPGFVDSDKAAAQLLETDEFKKSEHIKVNIDRALHAIKLQTLLTGKNLYLPGTRDSKALYLKVDVPEDATDEQKKEVLHVQDVQQHRTEITLENKVKFDIVVIGSVVVSRDGYRIGRGNGFTDLDIGMLIEIGSITPETIIATMVHDVQVVDTLPTNLFQTYDTPVDLIVTPTEVIRVAKRLPRPNGVFWELLSERRLKIVPVLQVLKENSEKAGKVITLKEEDTDIEQHQNGRNRRRNVGQRRRFGRRGPRRTTSQTDTEQQAAAGEPQQKRNPRRNRRFTNNRRRRPTKSEGDQSGVEATKSQERKVNGAATGDRNRKQRTRRQRTARPQNDFCIKLTNISRDIRVKDLKTELRKRECNPLYISWKGQFGKCYLHFGNRNGSPSTEDDINKVLQSLNDLSLTASTPNGVEEGEGAEAVQPPQPAKPVNVELVKFDEKKDVSGNAATTNGIVGVDSATEILGTGAPSVDTKKSLRERVLSLKTVEAIDWTDKASKRLMATDEFKKSLHINIILDRILHTLKILTLIAGKSMYLPRDPDSKALYVKVNVAPEATDDEKLEVLLLQDKRIDILLEDENKKLDIIVIDSVVVSRDGYRIGKGDGFTDLNIGLLIEVGAITSETIIATLVRDEQLVDSLPISIFEKFDIPIDMIVTPTKLIRVAKRLPRPDGIFWELLTKHKVDTMPVLQVLKEIYEKAGKVVTLRNEC